MSNLKKGVWAALLSNILFGVLYLYSGWMQPMGGTDVFAWRMVSMLAALWLILLLSHGWHDLFRFAYKVGRDWRKWALIVLPTPIVASQLWLFMWAPVNGYGVDVAMGYFLFPLVMVLCGRLFLGEAVNRLQWLAVALAGAGVAHELWQTHAFSWVTIWVFATYPVYYLLRRLLCRIVAPAAKSTARHYQNSDEQLYLTIDLHDVTPLAAASIAAADSACCDCGFLRGGRSASRSAAAGGGRPGPDRGDSAYS